MYALYVYYLDLPRTIFRSRQIDCTCSIRKFSDTFHILYIYYNALQLQVEVMWSCDFKRARMNLHTHTQNGSIDINNAYVTFLSFFFILFLYSLTDLILCRKRKVKPKNLFSSLAGSYAIAAQHLVYYWETRVVKGWIGLDSVYF